MAFHCWVIVQNTTYICIYRFVVHSECVQHCNGNKQDFGKREKLYQVTGINNIVHYPKHYEAKEIHKMITESN